jgi:hypothetical protein
MALRKQWARNKITLLKQQQQQKKRRKRRNTTKLSVKFIFGRFNFLADSET